MGEGDRPQGHSKMMKRTVREGEVSKMQGCPEASPYRQSNLTVHVPSQVCAEGCPVGSFKPAVGGGPIPQKSRKMANPNLFSPESWLFHIYQPTIAEKPAASPAVGGPESQGLRHLRWAFGRGEVWGDGGLGRHFWRTTV